MNMHKDRRLEHVHDLIDRMVVREPSNRNIHYDFPKKRSEYTRRRPAVRIGGERPAQGCPRAIFVSPQGKRGCISSVFVGTCPSPFTLAEFFRHRTLALYAASSDNASIRRSMLTNNRRVRWLSASNSQ